MDVVAGVDQLEARHGRLMFVIGVFDGLHRGHRYLLRHLEVEARRRGARAAVITFDHHPDEVILGVAPPLLCDPAERLELLDAAGVDLVVVQHFDARLRATPYDDFVRTIADRVDLAGFLMTPDAAFGHDREGTPGAVAAMGQRTGFDVVVLAPLDLGGHHVRSTDIRASLAAGDLVLARRLLGRPVEVVGRLDGVAAGPREREVRFELPVALPAPGRYRASIRADGEAPLAGRRVVATVEEGILRVSPRASTRGRPGAAAELAATHGAAGDGRVRVRFLRVVPAPSLT